MLATSGDPADSGDQPDVRELRPPGGLKISQQVEFASVISAVVEPAQRNHAERVAGPAQRARDQARRIDPVVGAADDAAALRALSDSFRPPA
jgi:hypothetical protein